MREVIVPYVRVLQAPACRAVSLDEAKEWCRVDHDDEDTLIGLILQAAEERCEQLLGRALVQRQLELRLDRFPCSQRSFGSWISGVANVRDLGIALPFPPLISVESITYRDESGGWQTLTGSPSEFEVDTGSEPGRVAPLLNTAWPATADALGAVRIAYTCGYAAVGSPTDDDARRAGIPALARQWMQARISTIYDHRDQLVVGNVVKVPRDFVDGLLDGIKVAKNFA